MSSSAQQVRNSFIYMVPMAVAALFPLATLPLFTRILGPADYGVIALGAAYGLFVTGVVNLGLPLTYERNFFQYREQQRSAALLYSVLAFVVPAVALGAVLTWVFRAAISTFLTGSPQHGAVLIASYGTYALLSVKLYFLTYLKNEGDARTYGWYGVTETVLWTVFSVLLVAGLRVGAVGLPLGQLIGSTIVVGLLCVRFLHRLAPAFDRRLLEEALRMSLPLTPRLFLTVVSNNFDKYLLSMLSGLGGVGLYTIGQKLGTLVFSFMTTLQNVFAPDVYRRMFAGGSDAAGIGRYLTPFAYVSVGVALLVALFAEEVLVVLTPPEFHGAAPVVTVLALYYAILFFGKQPQLIYARKTGLVSVTSAVAMVLHVALSIVFVRLWGVLGAAWGVFAAGLLSTVLGVWLGQRHFRIGYEVRALAAMYGVLLTAAGLAYVTMLNDVPYATRLAVKVSAVLAYLEVGRQLGLLKAGVLRDIRSALRLTGHTPSGRGYAKAVRDR